MHWIQEAADTFHLNITRTPSYPTSRQKAAGQVEPVSRQSPFATGGPGRGYILPSRIHTRSYQMYTASSFVLLNLSYVT